MTGPVDFDDLVLLADCYYLPEQEGPTAEALIADITRALGDESPSWRDHATVAVAKATRLRDFCSRLATLSDRPLFHALSRRAWDLREELDLVVRGIGARLRSDDGQVAFTSDFHLPLQYRGGTAARLQRLLEQQTDGTFVPGTRR